MPWVSPKYVFNNKLSVFLRQGIDSEERISFDFHTFYYSYKTLDSSYNQKTIPPKKGRNETAGVRTENKMKKWKKVAVTTFMTSATFKESKIYAFYSQLIRENSFLNIWLKFSLMFIWFHSHFALLVSLLFLPQNSAEKLFCYFIVIIEKR